MKNQPNKIYLQTRLAEYGETCEDFDDLNDSSISWCTDKIYSDDLEYVSVNFIFRRIKELEKQKFDTTIKHGVHDFNVNSAVINELKQLLK